MEKKPGRPTRDPGGMASKIVPIRMTESERVAYEKAAERAEMTLSAWIRDRLDKAVKRESKRG
jgi:hypothetical protein